MIKFISSKEQKNVKKKKEKMLAISIFPIFHNVFKSFFSKVAKKKKKHEILSQRVDKY